MSDALGEMPQSTVTHKNLAKHTHEMLMKKANVDSTTGLENRNAFEEYKRKLMPGNFSILIIDMDKLKEVNDETQSHKAGDRGLQRIAFEMKQAIRDRNKDENITDRAFRIGGDEFAIILDGMVDREVLEEIAKRIGSEVNKHALSYLVKNQKKEKELSVSIGGSVSRSEEQIQDTIDRADKALYGAKKNGRNQVVVAE